jgi:hypothetical protein
MTNSLLIALLVYFIGYRLYRKSVCVRDAIAGIYNPLYQHFLSLFTSNQYTKRVKSIEVVYPTAVVPVSEYLMSL